MGQGTSGQPAGEKAPKIEVSFIMLNNLLIKVVAFRRTSVKTKECHMYFNHLYVPGKDRIHWHP